MKALIIYDSVYGNTEKIAKAIGDVLANDVKVLRVSEVNSSQLEPVDLLIIGSPTQGGRPTKAMQTLLKDLPESVVKSASVATFDTRLQSKFASIFGYAAGKIASRLKDKGGNLISSPEGFLVSGNKGPLKEGELERAAGWAKEILKNKKV